MNEINPAFGRQRPAPNFMQRQNAAEDKPLQAVAALAQVDAGAMQEDTAELKPDADYSLSVEECIK